MAITTQYVMKKAVLFTTRKHYGKVGDILMYQPPKVTVYRNGKLHTAFDLTRASIEALLKNGFIDLVNTDVQAAELDKATSLEPAIPAAVIPAAVIPAVVIPAVVIPAAVIPAAVIPAPVVIIPEPISPAAVIVPEPVVLSAVVVPTPLEAVEPALPVEQAAVAQILTAELGPDDDGSLPDDAAPSLDPAAPAAPKLSRRAKAAAAASNA